MCFNRTLARSTQFLVSFMHASYYNFFFMTPFQKLQLYFKQEYKFCMERRHLSWINRLSLTAVTMILSAPAQGRPVMVNVYLHLHKSLTCKY